MFDYCPSCGSRDVYFDNIKKFRCEACDFTFFQNVAAAAAAVLEYDGKIITIKRGQEPKKGMLDLPGGFLDPGETAEDGLKREIREELNIELGDLEQIVDTAQTRGLAHAMHHAMRYMDGQRTLKEVVDCVLEDVADLGLECLTPFLTGDIARFRAFELSAAINRMRTLQVLNEMPDTAD